MASREECGQERRRAPRFEVSLAGELVLEGRRLLVRVRDLSATGAYVEFIDEADVEGTREGLLFAPALGQSVPVSVRHQRCYHGIPGGVGLEMKNPSKPLRNRLAHFLDN